MADEQDTESFDETEDKPSTESFKNTEGWKPPHMGQPEAAPLSPNAKIALGAVGGAAIAVALVLLCLLTAAGVWFFGFRKAEPKVAETPAKTVDVQKAIEEALKRREAEEAKKRQAEEEKKRQELEAKRRAKEEKRQAAEAAAKLLAEERRKKRSPHVQVLRKGVVFLRRICPPFTTYSGLSQCDRTVTLTLKLDGTTLTGTLAWKYHDPKKKSVRRLFSYDLWRLDPNGVSTKPAGRLMGAYFQLWLRTDPTIEGADEYSKDKDGRPLSLRFSEWNSRDLTRWVSATTILYQNVRDSEPLKNRLVAMIRAAKALHAMDLAEKKAKASDASKGVAPVGK